MKKVCLSVQANQKQAFYFSSFRCSDKALLEVIDVQEFESEVGFSLWAIIGEDLD